MRSSAVPGIVRAACGVSQKDLATMVGWSEAVLSYYARGIRDGLYDVRTVLQFADAVGMPRAALLPLVFADADSGLAAGAGVRVDRRVACCRDPGMDTTPNRCPDGPKGPANDDVTFFETGPPSTAPLHQFKESLHECP